MPAGPLQRCYFVGLDCAYCGLSRAVVGWTEMPEAKLPCPTCYRMVGAETLGAGATTRVLPYFEIPMGYRTTDKGFTRAVARCGQFRAD